MKYYPPLRDEALKILAPESKYHWKGEDFSGLIWLENDPGITEDLLQNKIAELEPLELLKIQDSECLRLLNETDKKMVPDWQYPEDQPAWMTYRAELRSIIGCGEIRAIPTKPFGD